MNITTTCRRA